MKNELGIISIQNSGQIRILIFSLDINILDDSDRSRRFVLVCQNLEQAKSVYPYVAEELLVSINLDPIKTYITDVGATLTLGDVSRLHNDLMCFLEVRHVVPLNVFQDWGECADELMHPLNKLTRKVCIDGLSQGLTTKEILRRYTQAQDEIEFVPSEAFIKCTRLALEFVESALSLDQPAEEIMPYCLIPVPYYTEAG